LVEACYQRIVAGLDRMQRAELRVMVSASSIRTELG
jgi:hypothetical protein